MYPHKLHSIDQAIMQLNNLRMGAVTLSIRLMGLYMQTCHREKYNDGVS